MRIYPLFPSLYMLYELILFVLHREWAVLLPAWSVVLFLTAYLVYIALAIYATPELSHMSTVTGEPALSSKNDGP